VPDVAEAATAVSRDDGIAANKELVRRWFAELTDGHLDAAWALMDTGTEYWLPRIRRTVPIAAFAAGYRALVADRMVDGLRFDLGAVTAEADRVSVQAESHARLHDGTEYNNLYHFLFVIRDGRISKVWEYGDTDHARTVLETAAE
jgi:uncharacterized protein